MKSKYSRVDNLVPPYICNYATFGASKFIGKELMLEWEIFVDSRFGFFETGKEKNK